MTKFIAVAATTLMMAASPLAIAPASAATVNIHVGGGHHQGHGYHHRKVVEKRVIRHDRCSTKTVIKHRNGERIVRRTRTCG